MSQETQREQKPKVEGQGKTESEHVTLKAVDQNGSEVMFKVKKTTLMEKLKDSYGQRMGIKVGEFRFLFDGKEIGNKDTPDSLGMEDNDVIDVFKPQIGG